MSFYARANLFVGKYKVPKKGHITLRDARVRVLRGREVEGFGWVGTNSPEDPLWLIVEDGGFWPVMVELSDAEMVEMGMHVPHLTFSSGSATTRWQADA